ncbi:MAG: outer membrane lipoprotein chaperone LolA [Thermodesulfobacteriota bacterium]
MVKIILPIFMFLFALSMQAHAEDLDSVLNKVQKKYDQINSFHAVFIQESEVKALDKVQTAQGEVWFKKPGKMRWNYNTPNMDQIVSDGKTLWFYDEEEKQVIETPLNQVSETESTTTLLSGLGNLQELFKASFSTSENLDANGSYLLDLVPKNDEEYNKVTISVGKQDMMVNTIYLYDAFGNLTTMKLEDVKLDSDVSDSLFVFKAPEGTEVVKPPSLQ